jgi:3-oxoacyl-[acyl-carrier protein] reductase
MSSEEGIAGRVALVTGGAGGIGAAVCRELASAGATVAVGYGRSSDAARQLADALGGQAFGGDMSDPAAPERLVEEVSAALGPVQILVVNHGLARQATYEEVDAKAFDLTLAVNLRAPFLLARAALPQMRRHGFGRIVFISSAAAFRGGVIGPDYAASKAGLHGLTHFLASRTARDGVTVNAIAPGFVETPMLPGDPAELGESVPVGRVGRPEEVADLCLSIIRNAYVTSHVYSIDGGMHPR